MSYMRVTDNLRAYFHSDDLHLWPLHNHHLKELLGLNPKAKLPAEGVAQKLIGNTFVWVMSRAELLSHYPNKANRTRPHRIMCKCPRCGKWLPAGRLHQHINTRACDEHAVLVRD